MAQSRTRLRRRARNIDFASLHETFLIAAVATILVIRTQLWLTNYPQLGGHGLHIAHLLYGGALMAFAIGLTLTLIGRAVHHTAALIGGIGFGFFIDELGKFITADNNYFFRPAAALIYLIFVGLFLTAQSLQRHGDFDSAEYLSNAIDFVREAALRPLRPEERARALRLLDRAEQSEPLVGELRTVVAGLPAATPARPSRVSRAAERVRDACTTVAERPSWPRVVALAFVAWAVLSTLQVWELVFSVGVHLGHARPGFASDRLGDLQTVNVITLVSSLVSTGLVGVGVWRLTRGDRLGAYRHFERALLVAIFITRPFSFVESQFHAVFGLAIDLLLLVALRGVTSRQRRQLA
jgi:hypothetical protein